MELDESSSSGSSLLEPIQSLVRSTVNSPAVRHMTMPNNEEEGPISTASEEMIPDKFVQALAACDADSYRNIHCLLLIGCTLPITSAEAERTFSLLHRIKTYT